MEKILLGNIKGDRGDSGVYLGTGEMPADCNVQIDPNGDADWFIDQTYSPESTNPQSGVAVAEGIRNLSEYEVLADITLTEDVNILEIPKEIVAGYKDLFLLASLQTVGTSGDNQIAIQSVNGVLYFIYSSYTNKIDTHYGFWHSIETVGTVDDQYIYKSTFPKKLLANTSGNIGTFTWQGLNTNISEVMHDMTINKKAITYYRVVILGGNTFATGSRFVLYGKRG